MMKTHKEIDEEMKKLYNEAEKISEFLLGGDLSDDKIVEELRQRELICRIKGMALLWVMNENYAELKHKT